MCLLENPSQHLDFLQALDKVLVENYESKSPDIPEVLASNIPMLLKLMSSSRDRAILQFVLSCIFSSNKLHEMLGYTSSTVNNIKSQVSSFLVDMEQNIRISEEQAAEQVTSTIKRLEEMLEEKENTLERKRKRLAEDEEADWMYDIHLKRQKRSILQKSPEFVKKRIA